MWTDFRVNRCLIFLKRDTLEPVVEKSKEVWHVTTGTEKDRSWSFCEDSTHRGFTSPHLAKRIGPCMLEDGLFATAWVHRPDVVVIDWREATEPKLKPPTEALRSLLIEPVIPTGKRRMRFHVTTIALNSITLC